MTTLVIILGTFSIAFVGFTLGVAFSSLMDMRIDKRYEKVEKQFEKDLQNNKKN